MNKVITGAVIGSALGAAAMVAMECKKTGYHKKVGKKLMKVMGL